MKYLSQFSITLLGMFFYAVTAVAAEDIFSDYYRDTRKPAEANATNVYNAWGENMANLIESGARDGVVVDGAGDYAGGKIKVDGVGNIIVEKNANVGPVINKTKIKDSTIIIKNDSGKNKW